MSLVISHWSLVISQMPHAHIHKISPQLVGNLTEILPQPLPNVGKVRSNWGSYAYQVLVSRTHFSRPEVYS
ncbi:MAG: hypothetical protein RM368_32465 [Nostoc sp. DedSLP03]|nr:hypothetical protein [Nostoc sp. DedSLP03]